MLIWNDFKSDDPALRGRRLLLITQPQMHDGAQADIYDILVGYWHQKKRKFVAADSPATPAPDELWALHETICSVLARKLEAEKRSHEHRLNELRRRIGKASTEIPLSRPYPKVIQSFAIQNRLTKHGQGAAGNRAG
jgi:hypothetical protein